MLLMKGSEHMKTNKPRKLKAGQKIMMGRCASYEFYYDDLTKGHLCHDYRFNERQCHGNIFKMLACPFYDKPAKGKFKVTVTKKDLKTYEDEKNRIVAESKSLEDAEKRLYEELKKKYEGK